VCERKTFATPLSHCIGGRTPKPPPKGLRPLGSPVVVAFCYGSRDVGGGCGRALVVAVCVRGGPSRGVPSGELTCLEVAGVVRVRLVGPKCPGSGCRAYPGPQWTGSHWAERGDLTSHNGQIR